MRWLLLLMTLAAVIAACSSDDDPVEPTVTTTTGGGGGDGGGATVGTGGDIGFGGTGPIADFPADPLVEGGLPGDIVDLFAGANEVATGGPCVSEPTLGALVPRNWTPLLFEWSTPPDQNVFELRLAIDNQENDLVVYTTDLSYVVDAVMWAGVTANSAGQDIEVRVRSAAFDGTALTSDVHLGSTGVVHLAPVDAPGAVVYWTANAGTSFQGFTIGDTSSKTVLTPTSAGATSTGGNTTCVSCHASSPDGKLLIYTRDADDGTRAIDVRKIDGTAVDPGTISPSALALLGRHKQSAPIMSSAHYGPSDAVAITVGSDPNVNGGRYELVWTDLHATDMNGWGILARDGDPRNVSSPTWSRDGETIAYVSSAAGGEGVIADVTAGDPTMDIYTVPYNNRQGGNATPLPGASDPNAREFYPVYSADDTLLAFNRSDLPVSSYDQPSAELFVLPAQGGAPTRLSANDPAACTSAVSPGLTNSWARWAPTAATHAGKKYYWLVFSSKRRAGGNPQLYIAAVVTDVSGPDETIVADYPALYVTAQDPAGNNHTPAWDHFEVNRIPQ